MSAPGVGCTSGRVCSVSGRSLPRRTKARWVGEEVHASPAAPSTHLVESWLPEPVLPEQQGLGDGGGQQGGVLARLLHVRPAPLPGAQVEQQ